RDAQALGKHLHERSCEHEARPDCHEVPQIPALPMALNDDESAHSVGQSSRESKNDCERERGHIRWKLSSAMADVHHIAVSHDIVLAFQTQCSTCASICFRSSIEKLVPVNCLSANEMLFEIGVNCARSDL